MLGDEVAVEGCQGQPQGVEIIEVKVDPARASVQKGFHLLAAVARSSHELGQGLLWVLMVEEGCHSEVSEDETLSAGAIEYIFRLNIPVDYVEGVK